jgi:hypothetical protein
MTGRRAVLRRLTRHKSDWNSFRVFRDLNDIDRTASVGFARARGEHRDCINRLAGAVVTTVETVLISIADEHFRALRQLILEQNSRIAELTIEVRRLKEAFETTEVVIVEDERITSDELDKLLKTRQSCGPSTDN